MARYAFRALAFAALLLVGASGLTTTLGEHASNSPNVQDNDTAGTHDGSTPLAATGFSHAELLYSQALKLWGEGKRDDAISACNEAIQLAPENPSFLLTRSSFFGVLKEFDNALADSAAVLELDTKSLDARLLRARTFEISGQFSNALVELDEAVNDNPASSEAYEARQDYFARQGRRGQALADNDRLIQLDAHASAGWVERAENHYHFEEYDQAILYASKALELDPQNWRALHARGLAHYKKGELNAAVDDFENEARIAPNESLPHGALGMLLFDRGDYKQAVKEFERGIELNPDGYALLSCLAQLYATCPDDNIRNGQEAAELMSESLRRSPNQPLQWDTAAGVAAENSRFDDAVAWEEMYLQSDTVTESQRKSAQERLSLYRRHQPYRATRRPNAHQVIVTSSTTPAQPAK